MMRRRFGLLALAAMLVAFVPIDVRGSTDVAIVSTVAWWTKRPTAQPTTGPTSFEVASGIDGNESVAAIRVLIYGSVTKATLSISEAPNQATAVSVPKLQACPTSSPWQLPSSPGTPGAYADAPTPQCDQATIPLARDDKGTWTGDVTALLAGKRSEMSLMVVPAPDKTLPVPPTFFVTLATSRVAADGTPDVTQAHVVPPPPPPAATPSVSAPTHSPSITPSSPAATPITTTPATTPTTEPTATSIPDRLGGTRVNSTHPPKAWGKLLWIIPLSAIAAMAWARARRVIVERLAPATT